MAGTTEGTRGNAMTEPIPEKLGRYEIVRILGKGAMGVVYEGRDPHLGRRVAIKTARREVLGPGGGSPEMLERFLREARVAAMINHPGIITIYDADEEDGTAYIAMEFVEGDDLAGVLESRRLMDPAEAVELAASLAEALACAHAKGVVHRDIKPANIMLPRNGPAKIADFGIAREANSNLTQEGQLIGTPSYMSPEQFQGQRVDGRADLFSLAIILYELLTGERPFAGEAFSTIMHHVIKLTPTPPHDLNFAVPEALSRVVMKALSKSPLQRYADGNLFAAALRESLSDTPDPNILDGVRDGGGAMGETVLTGRHAPDGASATVIGNPADAATRISGSLPPGVKSGPAATSVRPPVLTDYTDMDLSASHLRRRKKHSNQMLLVAGAVAVALILLGGVASLMRKNPGATPQTTSPPAAQPQQQPVLVPAVPEEPVQSDAVHETKVRVSVYITNNDVMLSEFSSLRGSKPELLESFLQKSIQAGTVRVFNLPGATIRAVNPATNQPYSTEPLDGGYAIMKIPLDAAAVKYELRDSQDAVQDDFEIKGPACINAQTMMLYDPSPSPEPAP